MFDIVQIRPDDLNFPRVIACRLKFLDLSMAVCGDSSIIRDILIRCRYLVGLSLESCRLYEDTEIFAAIGRNTDLKFLNMALCQNVTQTGIFIYNRYVQL